MYPYKTHFQALGKDASSPELREWFWILERNNEIQGDKQKVVEALTFLGNLAQDFDEWEICQRVRGIRDMIRRVE